MSQEWMIVVLVVSLLLGLIVITSTKEEKKKKKGLVRFLKTYDTKHKSSPHSPSDHFTHFEFDVEGLVYKKTVDSFRCDRQLREQLGKINQEMEYLEVYRTNLFLKTPYFHKVEVPEIDQMQ